MIGPIEVVFIVVWILAFYWFGKNYAWPWLLACPLLLHSQECSCSACRKGWSIREQEEGNE